MQRLRSDFDDVLVPEEVLRIVATNIYTARVTSIPKMSQKALAKLAGVKSVNTIAKLEDVRDPSRPIPSGFQFTTILELGRALGLSAETLFTSRVSPDGKVPAFQLDGDARKDGAIPAVFPAPKKHRVAGLFHYEPHP